MANPALAHTSAHAVRAAQIGARIDMDVARVSCDPTAMLRVLDATGLATVRSAVAAHALSDALVKHVRTNREADLYL